MRTEVGIVSGPLSAPLSLFLPNTLFIIRLNILVKNTLANDCTFIGDLNEFAGPLICNTSSSALPQISIRIFIFLILRCDRDDAMMAI